jgi:hypothetical protein
MAMRQPTLFSYLLIQTLIVNERSGSKFTLNVC